MVENGESLLRTLVDLGRKSDRKVVEARSAVRESR